MLHLHPKPFNVAPSATCVGPLDPSAPLAGAVASGRIVFVGPLGKTSAQDQEPV